MNTGSQDRSSPSSQAKALAELVQLGVLYTRAQAAELLAISPSKLNRLVATKQLTVLPIGRRVFINPSVLEGFMDRELDSG